jgi:hypothetical protein
VEQQYNPKARPCEVLSCYEQDKGMGQIIHSHYSKGDNASVLTANYTCPEFTDELLIIVWNFIQKCV